MLFTIRFLRRYMLVRFHQTKSSSIICRGLLTICERVQNVTNLGNTFYASLFYVFLVYQFVWFIISLFNPLYVSGILKTWAWCGNLEPFCCLVQCLHHDVMLTPTADAESIGLCVYPIFYNTYICINLCLLIWVTTKIGGLSQSPGM